MRRPSWANQKGTGSPHGIGTACPFFAKPYSVFPSGFIRSDHKIACARIQDMSRKLNESQSINQRVFSVPDTFCVPCEARFTV